MNPTKERCAPETNANYWNLINWDEMKRLVKSLQLRIAKAIRECKYNKVKTLRWLLTPLNLKI